MITYKPVITYKGKRYPPIITFFFIIFIVTGILLSLPFQLLFWLFGRRGFYDPDTQKYDIQFSKTIFEKSKKYKE